MKYLLGTLSEAERTRLDERVFADDDEFEELEIAEEELIDRYITNDLGTAERKSFEQVLLKNRRMRERMVFARTLLAKIDAAPHRLTDKNAVAPARPAIGFEAKASKPGFFDSIFSRPRLAWAFAAMGMLALLATPVWIFWLMKLDARTAQSESQRAAIEQQRSDLEKQVAIEQARNAQLSTDLQAATDQRTSQEKAIDELQKQIAARATSPSSIALLTLFAGSSRGGATGKEITISPQTLQIRLILYLQGAGYQSYRANVKTPEGKIVYENNSLTARGNGRSLLLQFPANRLTPGDYLVRVEGAKPSGESAVFGEYSFRVKVRR